MVFHVNHFIDININFFFSKLLLDLVFLGQTQILHLEVFDNVQHIEKNFLQQFYHH